MVRHSASRWTVAVLALGGWAWPVAADAISGSAAGTATSPPTGTYVFPTFGTGNVATDMPQGTGVTIIPGRAEDSVAQPAWMTQAGLINGYVMKDIRLSYDQKSDTLAVGVNFWGVAGDTDGSPDGKTDPRTIAAGGSNPAHLGGDKSITIALTPVTAAGTSAAPVVVAGVSSDKTNAPAGTTDGFNVATYKPSGNGLTYSYGQTLTSNLGQLAFDPSSAHPGFEFTIKNFSTIPGLNALKNGFYLQAYSGSANTTIVGKSEIFDTLVGSPVPAGPSAPGQLQNPPSVTPPSMVVTPPTPLVTTPEPTTILAWGLVVGGMALRYRRRVRSTDRS